MGPHNWRDTKEEKVLLHCYRMSISTVYTLVAPAFSEEPAKRSQGIYMRVCIFCPMGNVIVAITFVSFMTRLTSLLSWGVTTRVSSTHCLGVTGLCYILLPLLMIVQLFRSRRTTCAIIIFCSHGVETPVAFLFQLVNWHVIFCPFFRSLGDFVLFFTFPFVVRARTPINSWLDRVERGMPSCIFIFVRLYMVMRGFIVQFGSFAGKGICSPTNGDLNMIVEA